MEQNKEKGLETTIHLLTCLGAIVPVFGILFIIFNFLLLSICNKKKPVLLGLNTGILIGQLVAASLIYLF